MVDLGAILEARGLDLAEIADMHVGAEFGARPQPGERSDDAIRPHGGAFHMAERPDRDAVADGDTGAKEHIGTDRDIAADLRIDAEIDRGRIDQRSAIVECGGAQALLGDGFRHRQVGARVDAEKFLRGAFDDARA